MIQVTFNRNGNIMEQDSNFTEQRALEVLLLAELGFGGIVTHFSEESIITRTVVMGSVDITTFSGTKEEMKNLVLVTVITTVLRERIYSKFIHENLFESVQKFTNNSSFLIEHGSQILNGAGIVRGVCLSIVFENDLMVMEKHKRLTKNDLFALLCLKLIDGASKEELLQLV